MRALTCVARSRAAPLAAALALAALACSRSPGAPHGAANPNPPLPSADAGERIRIPLLAPAAGTVNDRELDVPITWLFLPEEPVTTGSAPNVIVAAQLPCGFAPVYGSVTAAESPLRVRLHAMFQGPGTPRDRHCDALATTVQFVSLQRLRLGEFDVTDLAPHRPSDPPMPHVTLHVIADDPSAPARDLRRVRRCLLDTECTAGGICAAIPGQPTGTCVPPLDPYLASSHPCEPGTTDASLERVSSRRELVRACLPACDATHACTAPLECIEIERHHVCAPHS